MFCDKIGEEANCSTDGMYDESEERASLRHTDWYEARRWESNRTNSLLFPCFSLFIVANAGTECSPILRTAPAKPKSLQRVR